MSEPWKTVPVREKGRKALMKWAEWEALETGGRMPSWEMGIAARQFREDVLREYKRRDGTLWLSLGDACAQWRTHSIHSRDPIRATPARERIMTGFSGRKAMELNGAVIAWMYTAVPEDQKTPSGNFAQVPAEGFGEWGGWWGKTMISGGFPWSQLAVVKPPAENPLFAEFWGPEIPLRATPTITRRQARGREQARRDSIDNTSAIEVFEIPAKFLEFYTETGLGTRAIRASLPSGVQVRFTEGSLGVVHDNFDAKPGLVVRGHPTVFTGYQTKLLGEIDETNNLDLANVKDADGNNVLDADGNPIPITWMPAIASQWIALRAEIQKGVA